MPTAERRLLVVGAHAADFVWRSAGAIALTTRSGGKAVVSLSYGARGESGELWSQPHQTLERVVSARHKEATAAAGRQPQVYFFEPHHPDSSEFVPDVYLDITSVHEIKAQAMAAIASQRFTPQVVDSL